MQDWQTKCLKINVNSDVIEEWNRIAKLMSEVNKGGKGSEESASEMLALLEGELKTVHDVMGKKWRCDASSLCSRCHRCRCQVCPVHVHSTHGIMFGAIPCSGM
jgi:hypothetical protein